MTDQPTDDEQAPDLEGVGVEYVDPEPDEESGADLVQLVRTGWVRFVIEGHGRVRIRPPRFGELRRIMEAYENLVDELQQRSHATQAVADRLNLDLAKMAEDEGLSPEDRHQRLAEVTITSRRASAELTTWRQDEYLRWWQFVHAGDGDRFRGLGVGEERMPEPEDMPLWLGDGGLVGAVLRHWQSVPLDRGKR